MGVNLSTCSHGLQSEQMLLEHLFPKSPAKSLSSIFRPSLNLFEDVLTSQIATIKKSLATSTFYAFGLYQTLLQHETDWQEVTAELDLDSAVPRLLAENANTLRSTCLRSFPEVLVDIRASQSSAKGDTSSTADVTYRVCLPLGIFERQLANKFRTADGAIYPNSAGIRECGHQLAELSRRQKLADGGHASHAKQQRER